jgi:hypothetical protein
MKKKDITLGTQCRARVGTRIATVIVVGIASVQTQHRPRTMYEIAIVTGDVGQNLYHDKPLSVFRPPSALHPLGWNGGAMPAHNKAFPKLSPNMPKRQLSLGQETQETPEQRTARRNALLDKFRAPTAAMTVERTAEGTITELAIDARIDIEDT